MSQSIKQPSVVALGTFDGMHIGHRQVIGQAVEVAHAHGCKAVVFTFENHPRSIYGRAPAMLMTADERRQAMQALGVDTVDMVHFDREMAEMSPRAFLDTLRARYDVRAVVAGSDFTFGYKGAGTIDTLHQEGQALGFDVYEVEFVMLDGQKVSSTRIRNALAHGETTLARIMLGTNGNTPNKA